MLLELEPLGTSNARIVHKAGALLDLPLDEIRALFREAGALVFRGFDVDPQTMKTFAERFSTHFNRDRLRPPVAKSKGLIQLVTEGMGYVEPHSEQANTPFRPDAVWFCCETPAAEGGETLLWDGVAVLGRLSVPLQSRFREKRVRFFQRYTKPQWQLFLGGKPLKEAARILGELTDVSYFIDSNETIYLEYLCSAIVLTRFGGQEAFANSVLSERANTLGALMSFDDGVGITDDDILEVTDALDAEQEAIHWQPGDLAFIDNSRFMHGRNPYTDPRRRIYSSLSFLNF